jgi:hypothetical protein
VPVWYGILSEDWLKISAVVRLKLSVELGAGGRQAHDEGALLVGQVAAMATGQLARDRQAEP